jgi:tripartite-type tricarboxylate transporter receptor subunit TctC
MKSFTCLIVRCFVVIAVLSVSMVVHADNYPSRDITFINPYAPGGSTDLISREFSILLEKALKGSVNVVNKPGANATIGVGTVVRAKPDGYTIGLAPNSTLCQEPLVNSGLAWKTPDDYQSIVKLDELPAILTVAADAPWKTFEQFMAYAKTKQAKIRASVSGLGGTSDLIVKHLNKVASTNIISVPFTGGGGEALISLLGGRVEAVVGYAPGIRGQAQAGKVRVLGVFKKGKYSTFPDAASIYDAGYDVTLPLTHYVVAPNGMPSDVLDKLVNASLNVARSGEFAKFANTNGYVVDVKGPVDMKSELNYYHQYFAYLMKLAD